MPDEPNLNPTQSANVPDPAAPTMTDPQKLVDEALAAPAPTPTAAPTLPTEAKTELTPEVPETEEATVPAELITPPARPSVESLPPSPEPAGAPDTSTSTPPVTEPTPPPTPAETPMTDEMPLAFANSMPAETPKAEETTMPVESTAPVESAAPPVFVPPAPSMTPPVPEKKKGKKMGKVLAAVLGFFLLAGGIVGGYYYYINNFGENATIAAIDLPQSRCSGCDPEGSGHLITWRNGKCVQKARLCDEGGGGGGDAKVSCSTPGAFQCGKTPDGCGGFCINGKTKTCDQWLKEECNWDPVRGATPSKGACTAEQKSQGWTECSAGACGTGSGAYCFNRPGSCNSTIIPRSDGTFVDTGLCGIVGSLSANSKTSSFTEKTNLFCTAADVANNIGQCATVGLNGLKYNYFCDINGCNTSDAACKIVHYKCKGSSTGNNSCTTTSDGYIGDRANPDTGGSKTFSGQCGTVEQIDVMCGGYTESRSRFNGPCDETTTTTTTPTLACTGLTQDRSKPRVGEPVKFMCLGASTPAGAVSLTYQFQIQKDAGEWQALIANGSSATYTIPSAGTYKARCRVCGTINNANVCDPSWTGVTP